MLIIQEKHSQVSLKTKVPQQPPLGNCSSLCENSMFDVGSRYYFIREQARKWLWELKPPSKVALQNCPVLPSTIQQHSYFPKQIKNKIWKEHEVPSKYAIIQMISEESEESYTKRTQFFMGNYFYVVRLSICSLN